jgi:hypothetical protein
MQRRRGVLKNNTDVKIFILFLLNALRYPITQEELTDILIADGFVGEYDVAACFSELCEMGHIYHAKVDGQETYMISATGIEASAGLEDSLFSVVRTRSLQTATRYLSLRRRGADVEAKVTRLEDGRYSVFCRASDKSGEIASFSLTIASQGEAERIRRHFIENPEAVVRGVTATATGEIAYLLSGFNDDEGV